MFDYQQLQEGFSVMLQNYDATQEANGVSGAYALVEQLLRLYVHAEPAVQAHDWSRQVIDFLNRVP